MAWTDIQNQRNPLDNDWYSWNSKEIEIINQNGKDNIKKQRKTIETTEIHANETNHFKENRITKKVTHKPNGTTVNIKETTTRHSFLIVQNKAQLEMRRGRSKGYPTPKIERELKK